MEYEDISWYSINDYRKVLTLPNEVWKEAASINTCFYCSSYSVSNYGRVRIDGGKFGKHIYTITDNASGYKKVTITNNYRYKSFYIHRLVAEAFIPNPDNLPQVNHKSSGLGKFDNRAINLEWCTESENIRDAHKNHQMDSRTKEHTSIDIRSDAFVAEMYRKYKKTGKVGATAREFGVPRTTLSSIVNKRSRRDITDKIDKEIP